MRKKSSPNNEGVVSREILERARQDASSGRPKRKEKCVVCGGPVAPTSTENLCWVCRRLKISAWREVDQQMPVQE